MSSFIVAYLFIKDRRRALNQNDRHARSRRRSPPDDILGVAAGSGQASTRFERQVRPLVIAALDRRLPAQSALRTRVRCSAGFRPPYTSRAAQSLVGIALRIAAISAAASWAIVTDAEGVDAHWTSTRSPSSAA